MEFGHMENKILLVCIYSVNDWHDNGIESRKYNCIVVPITWEFLVETHKIDRKLGQC